EEAGIPNPRVGGRERSRGGDVTRIQDLSVRRIPQGQRKVSERDAVGRRFIRIEEDPEIVEGGEVEGRRRAGRVYREVVKTGEGRPAVRPGSGTGGRTNDCRAANAAGNTARLC